MPLYASLSASRSNALNMPELLERRRVARLIRVLRHGNDEERRQALKMKMIPIPENCDAMAVHGTAILDISSAPDIPLGTRPASQTLDHLAHLGYRHGGFHRGNDHHHHKYVAAQSIDYSSFMEVLCPKGCPLLDSLLLTPLTPRQPLEIPTCENENPQLGSPLSSPQCRSHTLSSAAAVVATLPEAPLAPEHHTPAPHRLPLVSSVNRLTSAEDSSHPRSDITYVDAPVTLSNAVVEQPASLPENHRPALTHGVDESGGNTTPPGSAAMDIDDGEVNPRIFVSGGFMSLTAPYRRSVGHSLLFFFRRSPSGLNRTSSKYHGHCNPSAVANLSITRLFGHNALDSPSDPSSRIYEASSAHWAFPADGNSFELGGRVLFTDRFVEAQSHTALPTMISAFKQYMCSLVSTASHSPLTQNPSLGIYSSPESGSSSKRQQIHRAKKQLDSFQHGIPLKSHHTNKEVERCVHEAMKCIRPTFRRIEPVDLYGTSQYLSPTSLLRGEEGGKRE
ncbi:hypothetical protein JKF63_03932 [Porcisia hertigi]|uniref:Uncharacterized protein n=1 Tax=Porcisia hertigi TaxID=2761500 RepID=A0A836IHD3_9TRYP|nr:hypothetical protein JKF63_03932 [Porcisia hertigi]